MFKKRANALLLLVVLLAGCVGVPVDEDTIVKDIAPVENRTNFVFPVGYREFNEDGGINFLLNRIYSMGYARYDDMVVAGKSIVSREDLNTEMVKAADAAVDDGRFMNAAFYYRAAELYTPWSSPDKATLYDRFTKYFYIAVEDDDFDLVDIPYNNTVLPVMRIAPENGDHKGTIIVHSGYDGFKEELYSTMRFLSAHGYEVVGFDVPWMGRARAPDTEGFDHKWEKLIAIVLDYYELDDVSIFGISFGGWLSLRAAAFEPRIKRVIASSVSFDVNQYVDWFAQVFTRFIRINMREFTNDQIVKQMDTDPQTAWFFDHLMHMTKKSTPIDAANVLAEINE